jgi:hypothetical protein
LSDIENWPLQQRAAPVVGWPSGMQQEFSRQIWTSGQPPHSMVPPQPSSSVPQAFAVAPQVVGTHSATQVPQSTDWPQLSSVGPHVPLQTAAWSGVQQVPPWSGRQTAPGSQQVSRHGDSPDGQPHLCVRASQTPLQQFAFVRHNRPIPRQTTAPPGSGRPVANSAPASAAPIPLMRPRRPEVDASRFAKSSTSCPSIA